MSNDLFFTRTGMDRDRVQATWSSACFEASGYQCDARLWHAPSNQYRRCLIRATPIRNDDGTVREWVGSCTEQPALPREGAAPQG